MEDSDWDDPYEIASVAYVEDYNCDVPEGMDLMVHERRRGPYSSEIREDQQTGLTQVFQTSLCATRDELDTVHVDSLTEAFAEAFRILTIFIRESFRRMKRISVIRTMAPLRTMMDILV